MSKALVSNISNTVVPRCAAKEMIHYLLYNSLPPLKS
jgi:hypothetical protein